MIGVRQTKNDNCVSACVASILEWPITAVPAFEADGWGEQLASWLLPRGWAFLNICYKDRPREVPVGYSLAAVPAGPGFPDGWKHCVVCLNGRVVWDPARGKVSGLTEPDEFTVLYPLNPTLIGRPLLPPTTTDDDPIADGENQL